jgi:hypothetical protein
VHLSLRVAGAETAKVVWILLTEVARICAKEREAEEIVYDTSEGGWQVMRRP